MALGLGDIKIVMVGCGRIATLHVLGYENNSDAELYGVYDKDKKKAKAFAEEHGIRKVYDSYEEVLADQAVDGVELLVPHFLHCEMTLQACEAKKHVSVQKPMAMNLAECDKMISAAAKNGVKLKVYENFVFYPPYRLAKKMFDSGEIGDPVSIRYKMNTGSLGSQNAPAAGARAKMAGVDMKAAGLEQTGWKVDPMTWAWRMNDSLSGGGPLVFDDGYHKFSVIIDMFGDVEKVSAWIDTTQVVPGLYQDCPAMIMWKHKSGKQYGVWDIVDSRDMYIQSKYCCVDERMEITGSRGILWVTRCTATMMPEVAPVLMYKDGKLTEYWDMPSDWGDSFIDSTLDFIDSIKNDREPILTGERGREVLKFSLATMDSAKQGKEIYLDDYEDKKLKKRKGFFGAFGKHW